MQREVDNKTCYKLSDIFVFSNQSIISGIYIVRVQLTYYKIGLERKNYPFHHVHLYICAMWGY